MDWIGAKMNWIKKIRYFAHPHNENICGAKRKRSGVNRRVLFILHK